MKQDGYGVTAGLFGLSGRLYRPVWWHRPLSRHDWRHEAVGRGCYRSGQVAFLARELDITRQSAYLGCGGVVPGPSGDDLPAIEFVRSGSDRKAGRSDFRHGFSLHSVGVNGGGTPPCQLVQGTQRVAIGHCWLLTRTPWRLRESIPMQINGKNLINKK